MDFTRRWTGLEAALDYFSQRKQFGTSIAEFQGMRWQLAKLATDIKAARLIAHSAAVKIDLGGDATKACSLDNCFAGDTAVARTSDAVKVFCGSGYIRGFEVERLYRDAKITQIYAGTNQIQKDDWCLRTAEKRTQEHDTTGASGLWHRIVPQHRLCRGPCPGAGSLC